MPIDLNTEEFGTTESVMAMTRPPKPVVEDPAAFGSTSMAMGMTRAPVSQALDPYDKHIQKQPELPPVPTGFEQPVPESNRSILDKFFGAWEAAGNQHLGTLPYSMRIRAAQQDYDAKRQSIITGWQNYTKVQQAMKFDRDEHEQASRETGARMVAQGRASYFEYEQGSPEQAEAAQMHRKQIWAVSPESGAIYDNFLKKPDAHLYYNTFIRKHPELRSVFEKGGYAGLANDPRFQMANEVDGADGVRELMSRLPDSIRLSMKKNGMTESDFIKNLSAVALSPEQSHPLQADEWQWMKSYMLTNENGRNIMADAGVILGSSSKKRQEKQAATTSMEQAKFEDMQELKAKRDSAEGLTPVEEARYQSYLHPKSVGGSSKSTSERDKSLVKLLSSKPAIRTIGKDGTPIKNYSDAADAVSAFSAEGNHAAVRELASVMEQADKDAVRLRPQANADVGQTIPLSQTSQNYIDVNDWVRSHEVTRVFNTPSPAELRKGSNVRPIDDKQRDELKVLRIAELQSAELFGMSRNVLTGNNFGGALWQQFLGEGLDNKLTRGMAQAGASREFVAYADALAAWSGSFARTLGTERGVMTDRDIDRWTHTFPKPGDRADVVDTKIKMFEKMMNYVMQVNGEIIMGVRDRSQISAHIADPNRKWSTGISYDNSDHRAKMEGFLGSIENIDRNGIQGKAPKKDMTPGSPHAPIVAPAPTNTAPTDTAPKATKPLSPADRARQRMKQ